MKAAVIIGSLRRESYNRKLFEAYKELAEGAFEFQEASIKSFPLYDNDLENSRFPDVVKASAEVIRGADCLFFFSPEYNYSVPGVLKNAIDWLSRLDEVPFVGKPVALLGASPGRLGTARMQYHFRQIAVTMDMRMLNRPEIMVSGVNKIFNDAGALTDDDTKKKLEKHIKVFQEFANRF